MPDPQIVVIDYDAGNLRSVVRALEHAGCEPIVSHDAAAIAAADGLVLPGVGAAGDTMRNLRKRDLVDPIRSFIDSGRPFLGVCMGLQALFEHSDEGVDGGQECLGILGGSVKHFNDPALKVPHMGWNVVNWTRGHRIIEGIPSGSHFYFVHSFYPAPTDESVALGTTDYGRTFPSIVARDNLVATQFHPEKSGDVGLKIYANFVAWVRENAATAAAAGGQS